jgi:beta-glucosidase
VTTVPAEALGGRVRVTAENFKVQEGARRFTIADGTASVQLRNFEPVNIDRETNADVMLLVTLKVWDAPDSARIGAIGPDTQGFSAVELPVSSDYVRYGLPLKCLRSKGADVTNLTQPFVIETSGKADFAIGEVRLGTDAERVLACD